MRKLPASNPQRPWKRYGHAFLILFSFFLLTQHSAAQKPSISSFSPTQGPAGTRVTITGANFSPVASNNTVFFGDVKAVVATATANSLTVLAPVGATYRPLSVTTNGLTAYSSQPFTLTFAGGSAGFSPYSFTPAADSMVGASPILAATDLNGDGKLDLVLVNPGTKQMGVLKNTGAVGTLSFAPLSEYTTGNAPTALAIGDLDGDGKQDVVVVSSSANTLSLFQNKSTTDIISFFPKVDLSTGSYPAGCAVSDVDGDGKPDILCTNNESQTISVFRNVTSGGSLAFAPKTDFATGNHPEGVAVADLDGDGVPEIAVANESGLSVSVYKNRSTPGTISLDTKTDFANTFRPAVLAAADLDGDGRTDLVASSYASGVFSVLKNKSTPGSVLFEPAVSFPAGLGVTQSLSLADADGDGRVDMATNHYLHAQVSLVRNESVADTLRFAGKVDYTAGGMTSSVLLADLDGDSRPDMISANPSAASISLFRNIVSRPYITSFTPTVAGQGATVSITGNNFTGASTVLFGDAPASSFIVESPTKITAVVDTGASGDVAVTTGYGSGKLSGFAFNRLPTIQSFTPTTGEAGTVVTINGSNFTGTTSVLFGTAPATSFQVLSPSIITATVGALPPGSFEVSVTNAFGTVRKAGFYTGVTIHSFFPSSGPVGTTVTIRGTHFSPEPSGNLVYFGTVKAPVLSATATTLTVAVPPGTSYQPLTVTTDHLTAYSTTPFMVTFRGTGTEFSAASFVDRVDSAAGSFPTHVSITDLNDDGKPDVIVSNFASYYLSVSRNTSTAGAPSFAYKKDFPLNNYPLSTSVGDLDGDGKPDIFLLCQQTGVSLQRSYTVFQNVSAGDSILLSRTEYELGILNDNPEHSVITDLDGDGKPDVAVLSYGALSLLKNTSTPGTISFAPKVDLYHTYLASQLFYTDVDGDGKTDIIVTDWNINRVSVFRNISAYGQILFATPVHFPTGFGPASVFLGDLDGDGRPDMVLSNKGYNAASVYKNNSTAGVIAFGPAVNYPLGTVPENASLSDLDGDGRLDLAVATGNNKSVSVLRNTSTDGTITFAPQVEYKNAYNLDNVFIVDMSGDGKPDLVTNNPNGDNFSVFVNQCSDDPSGAVGIMALSATEFCAGDSVVLTTTAISGATYQWYKEGLAIAAATEPVYAAKVSGRYSVAVTRDAAVSTSAVLAVTAKPLPPVPQISLMSGESFCRGIGLLLRSSAPGGNQWYRNDVAIAGSVDPALPVFSDGVYKVAVTGNGCSAFSNPITATSKQLPVVSVTTPGTQFCMGDSITLAASGNTNFTYQWTRNEEPIPGASAYQFTTKSGGVYSVSVTADGCLSAGQPVALATKPLPTKPVITVVGSELRSGSVSGNQWYRDGNALAGATAQTYTPASNGNYTVQVTQDGCKSPMSESYSFVTTGVVTIDNTHFIRLSPNPANDQIRVEFSLPDRYTVNLDLFDLNGRLIGNWSNLHQGAAVDISRYANASYIARIYSRDYKVNATMIIIKQ